MRKTIMTCASGLWLALCGGQSAHAQQTDDVADLSGVLEVSVGFGEIPLLSGSFKPSVSIGYHVSEYIYFGWVVQLRDVLERGSESFNAVDTGLGGVERTREETGVRSLLEVRVRPHRYSPYLTLGMLFNGSDREAMYFDDRSRTIGSNQYQGAIALEQTRPWGLRPAIGIGYGYVFDSGLSLSMEMAGAFFLPAPKPLVRVTTDPGLSAADRDALVSRMDDAFADNLHNRHHLFNMAAGYVW